jgi:putative spermidine/putrescine transport system substrate-binding protein
MHGTRRIAMGCALALALGLGGPVLAQQQPLVVSTWGGNWKDVVERLIAKPFTAKTGIPVEFEVGGTIPRLTKAKVAKASPLVDVTFTTTHVARLYIADGLFEKLDLGRLENAKELFKEAFRSDYHLGAWAYVYTVAYRPDKIPFELTKWADLWDSRLARKIAMPDFDPSHIITVSAKLEGGNEFQWERGQERLRRLKPNIVAFFATDAQSQDLMKTGEAPVQVMLSANGYHLIDQGISVRLINPTDVGGIVGIDTVGIMRGTKKLDAAYKFLDIALAPETQEQIVKTLKVGPVNGKTGVPAALRGQPGIFTTPEEWRTRAYILDDEQRAKALTPWKEWFTANIVAR